MDWTAIGLREKVLKWLEDTAGDRYAKDVRLDPFATSMRNFDDVFPNLKAIQAGDQPAVNDPAQRITDLRGAGFLSADGKSLSALGAATLKAWEQFGVASYAIGDEPARLLLMALEAQKISDASFEHFFKYWGELRVLFDPLELIDNWDSLYAINYLDYERYGFAPGASYKDEKVPPVEIEFDLTDYAANNGGSKEAIEGGTRIENALGSKIPRGRHRATFCMALEMVLSKGQASSAILDRFGVPKQPRKWESFDAAQKEKINAILATYNLHGDTPSKPSTSAASSPPQKAAKQALSLPEGFDFGKVLVAAPSPQAPKESKDEQGKPKGPFKPNYKERSEANDEVGKLAEDFALSYEKWRLRKHPNLLKKIRHVSKDDDALGYDIESFETDGVPRYVEVKGTLGPLESRFFLTANEYICAKKMGKSYVILRAANLTKSPICCEIRHPFSNLELTPSNYSVTFKPPSK